MSSIMASILDRTTISIIVGSISGLLGGLFGIAGTMLMLPLAVLFNLFANYKTAIGTVLFSVLPPVSYLSIFEYKRLNLVDYKIGLILFISYFLASYLGSNMSAQFNEVKLKTIAAFIVFFLASYMLYSAYRM